jgi:molybdopterin molybdotransferase
MLDLEAALQTILEAVPRPRPETVQLAEAGGRYSLESIAAPMDLPPYDNSAMDGYAERTGDVAMAGAGHPVRLAVSGRVAAGQVAGQALESGQCLRIFTGSPLPDGADAVVMQEDVRLPENVAGDCIEIVEPVRPWENVRFRGEDVRTGSRLIEAGERIGLGQLTLLAATGKSSVSVGSRPLVGLMATGSELREPGIRLEPGQIYESNRLGLTHLTRAAGGDPRPFGLVHDDPEETRRALEKALDEVDCLVTSGGASVGEFDLVKEAFAALDGTVTFWKVAIRPGKPFVFGRLANKLFFGLPGNPVSALVTFLLLVRPALLRFQGAHDVALPASQGVLGIAVENPGDRRHFMRVKLNADGLVWPCARQGSHMLSTLARANGLIDVPPRLQLATGSPVSVLRWE